MSEAAPDSPHDGPAAPASRWGDPGPGGLARRAYVAAQFADFVRETERDGTGLYATLSRAVADDDSLLALADRALPGQRRPNILFAAVRLLLLRNPEEPLAAFHPDIAPAGDRRADPVTLLRDLCDRRRPELLAEITSRLVQTNEPRRCAVIRPGLQAIAGYESSDRLAICDVGTSAGITLRLNLFGYDYGAAGTSGRADARLRLACEVRGSGLPPLAQPLQLPWRAGVDLNPVAGDDVEGLRWLEALIWPGDVERLERLRLALDGVRADPLPLRAGNAIDVLPAVAAEAPDHLPLVIVTTYTLAHFTPEDRAAFQVTMSALAEDREVWWLTTAGRNELDRSGVELRARLLRAGAVVADRLLCTHHPHGRWLEWVDGGHAVNGLGASR